MKQLFILCILALISNSVQAQYCGCTNCPIGIPDQGSLPFEINVSGATNDILGQNGQALCEVRLKFNHTYLGDLSISLISPSGDQVMLVGPTGFYGATDGVIWDVSFVPCSENAQPDPGHGPIWNSDESWNATQYSGSYFPHSGCLESMAGNVNGKWLLFLADEQAIDVGVIEDFELIFCDGTGIACSSDLNIPEVALQASTTTGCAPLTVHYSTSGFPLISTISWLFPGGLPYTSSVPEPNILYENPGHYSVAVTVGDQTYSDSAVGINYINVRTVPHVEYTPYDNGGTVHFQNQCFDADTYSWDFGDGQNSTETAPFHSYAQAGTYITRLTASNICGSSSVEIPLTIQTVATTTPAPISAELTIAPNPSGKNLKGKIRVPATNSRATLQVIDNHGRMVCQKLVVINAPEVAFQINLGDLPDGVYTLHLMDEKINTYSRFMLVK